MYNPLTVTLSTLPGSSGVATRGMEGAVTPTFAKIVLGIFLKIGGKIGGEKG